VDERVSDEYVLPSRNVICIWFRQTGVQVRGQHAWERSDRSGNVAVAFPVLVPELWHRPTRHPVGGRSADTSDADDESGWIRNIQSRYVIVILVGCTLAPTADCSIDSIFCHAFVRRRPQISVYRSLNISIVDNLYSVPI